MMAVKKPAAAAANAAPEPALPFEQALERLETIVEELEGGSLTLDDSLARYEEGVKLSRRLTTTLDEAEKRIERLEAGESDEPRTVPMELENKGPEPGSSEGQLPF
jgi:exodeoxyribonuclease VII small subunit